MQFPRKMMVVAGSVGVIAALAAPSVSSAKTTKFVHTCQGDTSKNKETAKGTVIIGTCTASLQKGKSKFSGLMLLPKLTVTAKLKGGTVTYTFVAKVDSSGVSTAQPFKITKGTGKYKGAKGSGKITSDVKGYSKATGKITY